MACTKTTQRKATGPHGVPQHQLSPRHEGSSSGSNDPIGDLEARVARLMSELRHRSRERAHDSRRIAELSAEVNRLQKEIAHWLGRKFALFRLGLWGQGLAQVAELSASLENLQAYCNTLHEEVHVLYDRLHPNVATRSCSNGSRTILNNKWRT